MPRSKKPAVNANIVYFIGLIAFIALMGVLYLYTNSAVVGRAFTIDTGNLITTPAPSAGVTGGENCEYPTNGKNYDSSYNGQQVNLCFGTYNFPNGITISGNNIKLVCGGGVSFVGPGINGIRVHGNGNTVEGCDISNYKNGLYIAGNNSYIFNNIIHNTNNAVSFIETRNGVLKNNEVVSNLEGDMGLFNMDGTVYISGNVNTTISENNISDNLENGIYLGLGWGAGSSFNIISSNIINSNAGQGIYLRYANSNAITSNSISNNGHNGLYIGWSEYNVFSGNTISNNENNGLHLSWHSRQNTFSWNTFSSNQWSGLDLTTYSNSNSFSSNAINNNGYDGVYLSDVSSIKLESNTISNNGYNGVNLNISGNDNIISNIISNNNGNGVLMENYFTRTNNLTSNTISGNRYGIYMKDNTYNNKIKNNTIQLNSFSGVLMDGSSTNTFSENHIVDNLGEGIELQPDSNSNIFTTNTITDNMGTGILINASINNDLIENTLSSNSKYGLFMMEGASGTDLSINTICTNTQYDIFCGNSGPTTFDGDKCTTVFSSGCGFTSCPSVCGESGSVSASSAPTGASVKVDGVYKGSSPITISNIAVGNHVVAFSKTGYYSAQGSVLVVSGQTVSISKTLTPIPEISPTPKPTCSRYIVVNGKKVCADDVRIK
ncbi:MAG: right-handed parallel beta-helix repeat-containing protein [Candidatus Micrarchaeota archaeon]